MDSVRKVPRFRWILPAVQILFCGVVLWPIRNLVRFVRPDDIQWVFSTDTPNPATSDSRPFQAVDLDDPKVIRALKSEELREQIPAFLNLPVILVSLPYVILNPAKTEWVPRGMDFRIWRAISWPVVGMFFWWIAGLGLEALLFARRGAIQPRIGWISTTVGILVLGTGMICCLLLVCGPNNPDFPWALLGGAGAMWMLLGGLTVAAHVVQWRMRSRIRAAGTGAAAS